VPNNSDKAMDTLTYTNGEMLVTLGGLFDLDPDDICRWVIVITAHVPNEVKGTHDIRVASNCEDPDIPVLLDMGKAAL
jgi:hypothetical protein